MQPGTDAERELRRFRALAEQTTDFVAMADAQGRLLYVNPAGLALVGLPADVDVATLRLTDVVAPWVARDLRERRAAEQAARGMADAAAARLRAIVDGLSAIVWEADARSWEFTFVSERAEELLGYPVQQWLGDPEFWGAMIHPDDREAAIRYCAQSTAERDDYDFSYRAIAADGRVVWLHDVVHVVRDADGAARELQGVLVDVTERKAAEDRHRFLARLEHELQPLEDPGAIMDAVTDLLGTHLGADRCTYTEVGPDDDAMTAAVAAADDILDDILTVPVLKAGRLVASMAVHHGTPRRWSAADVELVATVVNRCRETLQRARAVRAVRESEERYRLLVERATELLARERESNRRLTLVQQVTAALAAAVTPTQVGEVILDYAVELGAAAAVVVQPGTAQLGVLAHRGVLPADLSAADRDDPLVLAMRTAEPVWGPSRVAVPLVLSGRAVGAIGLWFDGKVPVLTAEQRAAVGTLAAQCAQALDRARLYQAEHEVAEVLQRSLLPAALPDLPRLAASARYLPAAADSRAGGDWYDLLPIGGTTVALAVGDVVGHGPAAAAVMGQLRSALAGYLLDGHPPAAALERLDRFAQRVDGAAGSTCACLTLDWSTGQLCWALAGHPPVLLVDPGAARFLPGGAGTVLGVTRRPPYRQASTTIEPGASVVLYTDGLVERRDAGIDTRLDRLARTAREAGDLDPDALATALLATAHDGQGPPDDVALVVVRLIPAPLRAQLPATAGSLRTLRRAVAEWADLAQLPDERTEDLQLTLGEAAANAAEHAYRGGAGTYECEVELAAGGRIAVRVRDQGTWRPVPADNGYRGHGLRLINELAEQLDVERGPDGTDVRFTLPRATAPAPTNGTLVG